jgi:hypothetical protein
VLLVCLWCPSRHLRQLKIATLHPLVEIYTWILLFYSLLTTHSGTYDEFLVPYCHLFIVIIIMVRTCSALDVPSMEHESGV